MLINIYATVRDLPELDFPHQLIGQRDRSDEEFTAHLDGFVNYLLDDGQREVTLRLFQLMGHLQRTGHQVNLEVDGFEVDGVTNWMREANSIGYLADGTLRDPWGKLLLDANDGTMDDKAEVPFPPDAYRRKATSDEWLRKAGILVPPTLPPVVAEVEVVLRSPKEVARRALALFVVALRAESIVSSNELTAAQLQERLPSAFDGLSPQEATFIHNPSPDEQQLANFIGCYESLFVLQWALGMADELALPTENCDVAQVARVMLDSQLRPSAVVAKLRSAAEILNALDLHYRLHWATRQAAENNLEAPSKMKPGITAERHRVLNWLTRFADAEWDEVTTPT